MKHQTQTFRIILDRMIHRLIEHHVDVMKESWLLIQKQNQQQKEVEQMDDNTTNNDTDNTNDHNNNVLKLEQLNIIKKEEERMQDAVDDLYERVLTILMDDTDTINHITTNNNINISSSFIHTSQEYMYEEIKMSET